MRLPVILIAVAALLWTGSRTAAANPSEELDTAREKFSDGDYGSTVAVLAPLLYPTMSLTDEEEIVEAHLMLGVAFFELDKRDSAESEFEQALLSDPELTLYPVLYDDDVVTFFERKKAAMKIRLEEVAKQRRIAAENERLRQQLANRTTITIEKRDYYINFIPFGAGQFQNGERGKGIFFAVSEAALGGTSLALFSAQVLEYGFNGKVPTRDVDAVNRMQLAQVVTGGLFIGIAAWGVIDALSSYEPTKTVTGAPGPPPAPASSFQLLPAVGPDQAGFAMAWEF